MRSPEVIEYPESIQQLKCGLDLLAELLATTLGPTRGFVVHSTELKTQPELLSEAGTIARRMTELPDPRQNVGAMLLRNLVWRMHERVGDGGAITAVLAQAMLDESLRAVTAGANPMLVMKGLKGGAKAAVETLTRLSQPVRDPEDLVAVALAVTGEDEMSMMLDELFENLGSSAFVSVEDYAAPYLAYQTIDGGRWQASLISPYLVNDSKNMGALLQDVQVVLFDGTITSADEIRPALELVSCSSPAHLLIAAQRIEGEALNLLVATNQQTALKVIAVGLKRSGEKATSDLEDLGLVCGCRVISPLTGRRLASIRPEDLGRAAKAEAGREDLLIYGGSGDPAKKEAAVQSLRSRLKALPFGDDGRGELEMRAGRLAGKCGILKVGAYIRASATSCTKKPYRGSRRCS